MCRLSIELTSDKSVVMRINNGDDSYHYRTNVIVLHKVIDYSCLGFDIKNDNRTASKSVAATVKVSGVIWAIR